MSKTITKPLTLSGRYFSKKELIYIQQALICFPNLSLTELAHTLCEHLHWVTAKGTNKINSCLAALEKLEQLGYLQRPTKQQRKQRTTKKIDYTSQTQQKPPIACSLGELGPVELKLVSGEADAALWNEYVDRYHYLGYKHPIGAALKYFIVAYHTNQTVLLGCLLFSSSVWHLSDRDQWIGWTKNEREKHLNLVVNNTRFLIFPWVNVPNLASKALSMVTRQLQDDWQAAHAYRPVLIETFVDTGRYSGACYQASNWQQVGHSVGKDWQHNDSSNGAGSVKSIFMFPLQSNFRAILRNQKVDKHPIQADEKFIDLWGKVVHIISDVAQTFDQKWQRRQRVINSLLLIFLIFRLVFSKNSQGYGTTIAEFWSNCHRMHFPLPQKKPISASSFTEARKKLDENLFKVLNQRITDAYQLDNQRQHRWFNHRLFAVDGSKLNLPRPLTDSGYKPSGSHAHYPQGLLSCLYQLKSKIPCDFDMVNHGNERQCALAHLRTLNEDDVVVYDRGYFSYAMLYFHLQAGVHPIFRLQTNTFKVIENFMASDEQDQIVSLTPSRDIECGIKKSFPSIHIDSLSIRLIKYTVADKTYCIGTTLMDKKYTPNDFSEVYHARWGIEELYKISKQMIDVDDFHGKSERAVKQELFAHFVLITMSRLCANESENILSGLLQPSDKKNVKAEKIQTNFKNCLTTMSRYLENILYAPAQCIKEVMNDIIDSISRNRRKVRPNRSYARKSMKPRNKWLKGVAKA